MNTYTKTYMICQHCGFHTNASIDHLEAGQEVGPWYCEDCGCGFKVIANGVDSVAIKTDDKFVKTFDLLVLDPQLKPVYFVMSGKAYMDIDEDQRRYYYEEHSCPTNWIGDAEMIAIDGNTDPHGILRYIRSVNRTCHYSDAENVILDEFPEIIGNDGNIVH